MDESDGFSIRLKGTDKRKYWGHRVANRFAPTPSQLNGSLYEEGQYHTNQRSALYESSCEDHVGTDVACSLWLTCDTFNCFATDLADSEARADYGETCSNC
jgi:hypothetical protein